MIPLRKDRELARAGGPPGTIPGPDVVRATTPVELFVIGEKKDSGIGGSHRSISLLSRFVWLILSCRSTTSAVLSLGTENRLQLTLKSGRKQSETKINTKVFINEL